MFLVHSFHFHSLYLSAYIYFDTGKIQEAKCMEPSQTTIDGHCLVERDADGTSPTTYQSSQGRWVIGVLGMDNFSNF